MNSILKKTLVAAAVLGVTTANAATITTGFTSSHLKTSATAFAKYPMISAEGYGLVDYIEIGTDTDELPVTFTAPASGYNVGDFITLTVTGATVVESKSAPTLTVVSPGTGSIEYVSVNTDGEIVFRVGSTPTTGVSASAAFTLDGVYLTDASGNISLTARAEAAGTVFDNAASTTIGTVASELAVSAGTAKLDGEIDVEKERKQFTASSTSTTSDNFQLDVDGGADRYQVTPETFVLTLNGSDLEFLLDGDGDLDTGSFSLTGGTASTDADDTFLSSDYTAFQVSSTAAYTTNGSNDVALTLVADGAADADAQTLSEQSFTADMDLSYSYTVTGDPKSTDNVKTSGISVGAWTLSGKTVNIPYMPYGSGISQILYVSNDGSVNGDIELTAFDDGGNSYGPVTLSVAAGANSITNLSTAVRDALIAEGYNAGTAKMDITLVINSPSADIEVFAAYNVRGDRLSVTVQ